jgi:hypothetical protein
MTGGGVEHEVHEFLLNADNELKQSMTELPRIREYISELPETASTFRLKQIDGIYQPNFKDIHLEFLKSWRLHNLYAPENQRVYVNPHHVHAHRYTDLVVECECGTKLTRNYEDDGNGLRNEHEHADDCLPQWRLRARAQMTEMRYTYMYRLGALGWHGKDMAPRFGMKPTSIGVIADQFHTTLQDVFSEYRRVAGNTHAYLVMDCDEPAEKIADIYGHARDTMRRWAQEYGDVEYEPVTRTQFSEEDGGP